MTKTGVKIKQLVRKYPSLLLADDDITDAIEFVSELMEIAVEYTEREEPYAKMAIAEMKKAIEHIKYMEEFINEQTTNGL